MKAKQRMTASRDSRLSWLKSTALCASLPLLLPVAAMVGIWHAIKGGAESSPDRLARMLHDIAENGDISNHWDEFASVNLRDEQLEAIRQKALEVSLPINPQSRVALTALAEQARMLSIRP